MPQNGSFEEEYKANKNYWGTEPSKVISDKLGLMQPGTILDIGAGDGRNALYLAAHEFDVTALDISQTGLDNLLGKARNQGVSNKITILCADFLNYTPDTSFDNIITNFTIHFVGEENIEPFLVKMTNFTKPGGVNIIDDFTRNGPLAITHPENYITEEMLLDFYKKQGWTILSSETRSTKTKAFETPGKPYTHEAIAFVAQKFR
jgi:cyclopropane fatty-acyl-phospholipid synthase-like methyltransferase